MKSLAVVIAILFLALNGIGTLNEIVVKDTTDIQQNMEQIEFSQVIVKEDMVYVENCANLIAENKPIVPVYIKTYILPAGSKFSVEAKPVEIKNLGRVKLPASYIPAPPEYEIKEGSYDENIVYPEKWYSYEAIGGIKDGEHVVILVVHLYPVRYVAGDVLFADKFELKVDYTKPEKPLFNKQTYDLLIICPKEWEGMLETFVQHKENHGIKTKLVCLECLLNGEYFAVQGRDDAEKIKYFIKNAIEEWGIKYVLLVGGRKPGIKEEWYIPVRYVHVYWADEGKYISDLYYADIYDANYSFSSWDTDGNDIFSEWRSYGEMLDDVDLYPDVYIGRWACRNKAEVKIMIEKTISYENSKTSKKIVLAGGDNFEMEGIEGEIVCDKTLEYLQGFEAAKVYASEMDVTAAAIKNALGNGAMFMHLHGHGSPIYWSTHKPDGFDKWEKGIGVWDLPTFFNEEYPITVIGGCHTAMFNVSLTIHPWTGGIPSPEGLSWWFARKYNGGGIASLGYTAFPVATPGEEGDLDGDGINEPDCVESGYGYMQLGLFYAYGIEGKEYLGECWGYAVSRYVEHFKIPYERWHLHTIQAFVLLGDPTLKIGGY